MQVEVEVAIIMRRPVQLVLAVKVAADLGKKVLAQPQQELSTPEAVAGVEVV